MWAWLFYQHLPSLGILSGHSEMGAHHCFYYPIIIQQQQITNGLIIKWIHSLASAYTISILR